MADKTGLSQSTHRMDPYRNFRFRLQWEGRYVAGFAQVNGRIGPGPIKYESVTLERGVTEDPEFGQWARGAAPGSRRDLTLDVYNEAGQKEISYGIRRCRVSQFNAVPELDRSANAVAIEHLKLEYEEWERSIDAPRAALR